MCLDYMSIHMTWLRFVICLCSSYSITGLKSTLQSQLFLLLLCSKSLTVPRCLAKCSMAGTDLKISVLELPQWKGEASFPTSLIYIPHFANFFIFRMCFTYITVLYALLLFAIYNTLIFPLSHFLTTDQWQSIFGWVLQAQNGSGYQHQ